MDPEQARMRQVLEISDHAWFEHANKVFVLRSLHVEIGTFPVQIKFFFKYLSRVVYVVFFWRKEPIDSHVMCCQSFFLSGVLGDSAMRVLVIFLYQIFNIFLEIFY